MHLKMDSSGSLNVVYPESKSLCGSEQPFNLAFGHMERQNCLFSVNILNQVRRSFQYFQSIIK